MSEPPKPNSNLLRKLRIFVRKWLKRKMTPLPSHADTSVPTWLKNSNYPLWRKQELQKVWDEFGVKWWDRKYRKCKSFMKAEVYPEYKHARGINARHDVFKCLFGPLCKLIEDQLYKDPSFIKHVPVADRGRYIMDRLYRPGATYIATDYTAFETLFTKEIMNTCEVELYRYMFQNLSCQAEIDHIIATLTGENECMFRDFTTFVEATRMSGEMSTSLANGFSNLMFMKFMAQEKGIKIKGVVEGDDGLFRVEGDSIPTPEDFEALGLRIKLDVHRDLSQASFCGLVFNPEVMRVVSDPVENLVKFGWTLGPYQNASTKTKLMLLRCKAFSLKAQFPGCPIIESLANYGLRVTRSIDIRHYVDNSSHINEWTRLKLKQAIAQVDYTPVQILPSDRFLVESKFGVPVSQQLSIEKYLDSLEVLTELHLDLPQAPTSWGHYWESYAVYEGNLGVGFPGALS